LNIAGFTFEQFCIHNLIALTKALTSSILMILLFISHATCKSETDRLLTKARLLVSGKDSEEKVSKWCQEELNKVAEDHQSKISKNKFFLKIMMILMAGFACYSKYEQYQRWKMTEALKPSYENNDL
jgi:dolichol kinase